MSEDRAEERLIECPVHGLLPASAFYDANHRSRCRECVKQKYRDWYQANKAKRRASGQARLERIERGEPSSVRYKRVES